MVRVGLVPVRGTPAPCARRGRGDCKSPAPWARWGQSTGRTRPPPPSRGLPGGGRGGCGRTPPSGREPLASLGPRGRCPRTDAAPPTASALSWSAFCYSCHACSSQAGVCAGARARGTGSVITFATNGHLSKYFQACNRQHPCSTCWPAASATQNFCSWLLCLRVCAPKYQISERGPSIQISVHSINTCVQPLLFPLITPPCVYTGRAVCTPPAL